MNDAEKTGAADDLSTRFFALIGGFVCIILGMGLSVLLEDLAGLRDSFVTLRANTDHLSSIYVVFGLLVAFTAQPSGRGQWGLFGATVTIQSFAYAVAITIAGLAQTTIAPERLYFVPICVFLLVSWPILATGCLIMARGGIALAHPGYKGVLLWTALAIPGSALGGLIADLVDVAGAMPALITDGKIILAMAMMFPAWFLAVDARPVRPLLWALFGILMAALQISNVIISMIAADFVQQFIDSDSVYISAMVIAPAVLWPAAIIRLARASTGPAGPWHEEEDPA